ncbi:FkbM family methyltransferase [Subsaxibacter sp. CAU 1640]|uniref:FkbM family methyltransferase n=1 Tax=Subsaxibacter sp. CAU 1640 TaxID=2933271 RepID=UPI00200686C2|nr:FkbM family methyltransferase [Subsaxibacter sp. CAU 1640]MCK7589526.1 FkbM family methyltransferase [Subsaxibacter sp. CAU 1640]
MNNIRKAVETLLSKERRELFKISKNPRYKTFKTNILGFDFYAVDPPSFIAQYKDLIMRNSYLFKTNSPSPFIIDCGINIGLSIINFKRNFPNAEIIGFEPDPDIYRIAKNNILTAGYENVELIQKAVWTEETTLLFFQEGSAGGRIITETGKKTVEVQTCDLKKLINREVDFLKIDIEGAEYEVLESISTNLKWVRNIFVEYHSKIGEEQHLEQILAILKDSGFRCYLESGYIPSQHPFLKREEIDGFDNLINIYAFRSA